MKIFLFALFYLQFAHNLHVFGNYLQHSTYTVDLNGYSGRILACPENMTSSSDSRDMSQCVCVQGMYNFGWIYDLNVGCLPCPSNTFKDFIGNQTCNPCQANEISLPGSAFESDCLCAKGFTFVDASCTPCPLHQFKSFSGDIACTPCTTNSLTENTGSKAPFDCKCKEGYESTLQNTCNACEVGKFKNQTGNFNCLSCPANTYSTGNAVNCLACMSNSIRAHEELGDSLNSCKCIAGYEKSNNNCIPCAKDHFCVGDDAKESCNSIWGDHSISQVGSTNSDACVCEAGYYENGVCTTCPPNKYCPEASEVPVDCKDNSAAPAGSISEDACVCEPGYTP